MPTSTATARAGIGIVILFGAAATACIWCVAVLRAQVSRNETVAARAAVASGSTPTTASAESEEELAQIHEDLQTQELWIKAKEAQLKAAEVTAEVERSVQSEMERLNQKGVVSNLRQKGAAMLCLEADSGCAMARAELADLEVHYRRTKRRLERFEKHGPAAATTPENGALALTEIFTRLRLAEQAVTLLQEQLRTDQSHIRILERQGKFGDPQP
jgi:hypothetical protein